MDPRTQLEALVRDALQFFKANQMSFEETMRDLLDGAEDYARAIDGLEPLSRPE